MGHQFGSRRGKRSRMRRRGRDAYFPGAGAQCGLATQSRGARHALAATHHQHMTEIALVRGARPARQYSSQKLVIDAAQFRVDGCPANSRDAEFVKDDRAAVVRRLIKKQTALQSDKRHREIRRYGTAKRLAGVAVQAGRDIERQYRGSVLVDRRHRIRKRPADVSLQAAAEYRVDQEIGLRVQIACPARDTTSCGNIVAESSRRVAFQ